ncbi:MAG: hypothetical protein H2045_06065 [Rhizobiales bacterium]|nr:hypothetical protein [Hyphomicrobiales bacterium]
MAKDKPDSEHWLVRPATIRIIWIVSIITLALTVIADFFVTHHPHFGIDGTYGFGAWFGFLACVVLVVGSKVLGAFLKRSDTYYDQ